MIGTFKAMDEVLVCDSQMKATEQYFNAVLFIMPNKAVLALKSVDETLVCNHSIESYWAKISCDTVCYVVQGASGFKVCG